MNSPYGQKSGTFQIVLTGKDVADGDTFLTASRRINLSGNYRIRLTGFQGQFSYYSAIQSIQPLVPISTPNPLIMIVSPQFITNWTPDIQGPVIQWGSSVASSVVADAANLNVTTSNTFIGQPLNLEYRATLNNLFQIQVRACDLNSYASSPGPNPNSVPGEIPFDKTLADVFGVLYKTISLVLTFQFEQDI
jgi:hypothetical protein